MEFCFFRTIIKELNDRWIWEQLSVAWIMVTITAQNSAFRFVFFFHLKIDFVSFSIARLSFIFNACGGWLFQGGWQGLRNSLLFTIVLHKHAHDGFFLPVHSQVFLLLAYGLQLYKHNFINKIFGFCFAHFLILCGKRVKILGKNGQNDY